MFRLAWCSSKTLVLSSCTAGRLIYITIERADNFTITRKPYCTIHRCPSTYFYMDLCVSYVSVSMAASNYYHFKSLWDWVPVGGASCCHWPPFFSPPILSLFRSFQIGTSKTPLYVACGADPCRKDSLRNGLNSNIVLALRNPAHALHPTTPPYNLLMLNKRENDGVLILIWIEISLAPRILKRCLEDSNS